METNASSDIFEARLIMKTVAPFNAILPVALPEVRDRVINAFKIEGLNSKVDTTAYASNILWTLRSYFERNTVEGWRLINRRDCIHMEHETGLELRFTKSYAFTGGLSPAGHNISRQKAYMQGRLRTENEIPLFFGNPSLDGDVVQIAWTEWKGKFSFTAYLPKELGHFRKSPESWLTFPVGLSNSEYDNLQFRSEETAPLLIPKHNLIIEDSIISQDKMNVDGEKSE